MARTLDIFADSTYSRITDLDGSTILLDIGGGLGEWSFSVSGNDDLTTASAMIAFRHDPSGATFGAAKFTEIASCSIGGVDVLAGSSNLLDIIEGIGSMLTPSVTVALPTGASTSALQTTGNSSLSSIVTNTGREAVSATVNDSSNATVSKAVLFGKSEGGNYYSPVSQDVQGHLEVSIQSPISSFGAVLMAQLTPVAQFDFVMNTILTQVGAITNTGSGAGTAANQKITVATTAAASSSSQFISRRYLKYRSGEGGRARFTAAFTTGAANSKQYAGIGTSSISNGAFFGYNGTAFGICHVNGGVETWIPQASWNVDVCSGVGGTTNRSGINIVPTNLNVYQVVYQYLGAGNIFFFVENPENGQFSVVHIIKYANSSTATSFTQPSFSMIWRAVNTTNATNIAVSGASAALFVDGQRVLLGPKGGQDNSKATITTLTNIVTLKNCTTFNGSTNRGAVQVRSISFAANGTSPTGIATLEVFINATLGGSPVFNPYSGSTADGGVTITSGQSIVSFDIAGTTVTGGIEIYNGIVNVGSSSILDVTDLLIFLAPTETMTFAMKSTQSATCGVSASWNEDI